MKNWALSFFCCAIFGQAIAQKIGTVSEFVSHSFLSEEVKNTHGIHFPVVEIFHYADHSGSYYCVFSESQDGTFEDKALGGTKIFNKKIKAIHLKEDQGKFYKLWELNDFTIFNENDAEEELSIWFWNSYSKFEDLDTDGMVDPIVVYGTRSNFNYTQNGRLKIILYYKGKKVAIRHQNGILDEERKTVVDEAFYHLPKEIQNEAKSIMHKLENEELAIFPHNWKKQMDEKSTLLKDSKTISLQLDIPALFEQVKK